MAIYIPELNPIRFIQVVDFNYIDKFATKDNMPTNTGFAGEYSHQYDQKWLKLKKITFQIPQDTPANVTVQVVFNGTFTTLTGTDITPVGWAGLGDKILQYSYTPTTTGTLHFTIQETIGSGVEKYQSDCLTVISSFAQISPNDTRGTHLEIKYAAYENDFGMVFESDFDNPTTRRVYEGTIYLEGWLKNPANQGEKAGFTTDRGNWTTQRSTPRKGYELSLRNLPEYMTVKIDLIMSIAYSINGIEFDNEEYLSPEPVDSTVNMYNLSGQVFTKDWNYFYDHIPVVQTQVPFEGELAFWYIAQGGGNYTCQITGTQIETIAGVIDFNPNNEVGSDRFELLRRGNATIQNNRSRVASDYNPSDQWEYNESNVSQEVFGQFYNPGYLGIVYVKEDGVGNIDEILVYWTDRTGLDDKLVLDYVGELTNAVQDNGNSPVYSDGGYVVLDY